MRKKILVFLFSFVTIWHHSSQATTSDSQQWLSLTAQGQITESNPVGFYLETQFRRSNNLNQIYESVLRPALFYKTANHGSFFLGTMKRYGPSQQDLETRHWLQWLESYEISDFKTRVRLRFEQRQIDKVTDESFRARVLARISHSKMAFDRFSPFFQIELFHNLNSVNSNIKAGPSQTRTALGVSTKVNSFINADIGYQNVSIYNMTRESEVNHVLNMGLSVSF